jgi:hypothetical protein
MATEQPFSPSYGSGVTVSPGVASAASAVGYGNKNLVLTNTGATFATSTLATSVRSRQR